MQANNNLCFNFSLYFTIFADLNAICFGDSNVIRNKEKLKHGLLSACKVIPAYNFEQLKNKIHLLDEEDTIILHVLTNDIKDICQQDYKSDAVKERDLVVLAKKFCAICTKVTDENPNSHLYISMVPSRYDSKDQLDTADGREIVNSEIESRLGSKTNVTLIPNDIDKKYFDKGNFHYSEIGFEIMHSNWIAAIGKYE